MKSFSGLIQLSSFQKSDNSFIHMTVGNFDGLHLGHQALIRQVKSNQQTLGGHSCVYTFTPHPRKYFNPQFEHVYLQDRSSWREQLERQWKIDFLVEENFTKDFSETHSSEFLDKYWGDLKNLKTLVVGEDFRFGFKREGGVDQLRRWCDKNKVELFLIPPVEVDGIRVSTSLIRDCLTHGDLSSAGKYLGRHFSILSEVVKGQQKGRLLGFPTLNLMDERATLLRRGVYLAWVWHRGQKWPAVTNVGIRPTIHDQSAVVIESHVLRGLDSSLYGEKIEVEFVSFVREEKKFASLDELKAQIASDASSAQKYFGL